MTSLVHARRTLRLTLCGRDIDYATDTAESMAHVTCPECLDERERLLMEEMAPLTEQVAVLQAKLRDVRRARVAAQEAQARPA